LSLGGHAPAAGALVLIEILLKEPIQATGIGGRQMCGLGLPARDDLAGGLWLVTENLCQPGDSIRVGLEIKSVATDDGFAA